MSLKPRLGEGLDSLCSYPSPDSEVTAGGRWPAACQKCPRGSPPPPPRRPLLLGVWAERPRLLEPGVRSGQICAFRGGDPSPGSHPPGEAALGLRILTSEEKQLPRQEGGGGGGIQDQCPPTSALRSPPGGGPPSGNHPGNPSQAVSVGSTWLD